MSCSTRHRARQAAAQEGPRAIGAPALFLASHTARALTLPPCRFAALKDGFLRRRARVAHHSQAEEPTSTTNGAHLPQLARVLACLNARTAHPRACAVTSCQPAWRPHHRPVIRGHARWVALELTPLSYVPPTPCSLPSTFALCSPSTQVQRWTGRCATSFESRHSNLVRLGGCMLVLSCP